MQRRTDKAFKMGIKDEFHGLCIAFDQSSPIISRQLFPIFDPSRLMWVQKDMLHFLSNVAKSQKLLQFLSHLQKNEQNDCPLTFPI